MRKYPIRPDEQGPPKVAPGARVELELVDEAGGAEPLSVVIVPDRQADFAAGLLGAGTPLARAMLGRQAGEIVAYRQGDIAHVRILGVTRGAVPKSDAEAARQQIVQKAIDKSDLADAIQLALTVDVKWGGYDPEGILPPDEDEPHEGDEAGEPDDRKRA